MQEGTRVRGSRRPVRGLTLIAAIAVILANVVGTGVFVKARVMTVNVGTPGMVMAVWVLAGLLTLAGALVFAELSTMMPRSGGAFHFIGAAYGRFWAFLSGWTVSLASGASTAAVAILCITFFNDLLGGSLPPWSLRILPLVLIALSASLNLASVRSTGKIATALTAVKLALVLGIGVGAFLLADGSFTHFSSSGADGLGDGVPDSARLGMRGFGAAMLGALWSFNGWAIISNLGGEVKDPSRNLPRTMVGGTLLVIALYLLINAAYFYVLSPLEIANLPQDTSVASAVVLQFGGKVAASMMAVALVISAYGTLHTTLLVAPRLPYAMARKGLLPASLGVLSSRAVPAYAVLAVATWAIVLASTGSFDILTDIYVFVLWVFYGLTGSSLFLLRRKHPDANRPYRVWGYPFTPALFLMVTAFLLVNTFLAMPHRALSGFLLICSGIPVYAFYSRRLPADCADAWLRKEE